MLSNIIITRIKQEGTHYYLFNLWEWVQKNPKLSATLTSPIENVKVVKNLIHSTHDPLEVEVIDVQCSLIYCHFCDDVTWG